jgi:hypothetical protein
VHYCCRSSLQVAPKQQRQKQQLKKQLQQGVSVAPPVELPRQQVFTIPEAAAALLYIGGPVTLDASAFKVTPNL